jgi:hypothetical protein
MGISPTEAFAQATVSPPNEIGQPTFVEAIIITELNTITWINQDGLQLCPQTCNGVSTCKIQRDLFDPSTVEFARDLLYKKAVTNISDFRVFLRDFRTQNLTEITMTTEVKTKDSVVFIQNVLLVSQASSSPTCGIDSGPLNRIKRKLATQQEILPSRFVWP